MPFILKNIYHFFWTRQVFGLVMVSSLLFFSKKIQKFFKNETFILVLISIPAIIIFINILRNNPFFLWDDFDHLRLVNENSYLEILYMALSKQGIWVSHHMFLGFWLFKFIYDIFATNIYPYVILMFLLNLMNTLLFYFLNGEFIKNKYIKIITSFCFGFLYLSWISNIHELLGAFFLMISFFTFIKWIKTKKGQYGVVTILAYCLAIFSKEITFLLFPFMMTCFLYIKKSLPAKKDLKILIPYFLIFICYFAFYASTFLGYSSFSVDTGYKIVFDQTIVFHNLSFYLKDVLPGINIFYPLAILGLITFCLYSVFRKEYWSLIFMIGFLIFISPVLLFVNRVSSYYVYIPAIFLFMSFGKIGDQICKKIKYLKIEIYLKKLLSVVTTVCILIFIFNVDILLKNNFYLIVFPWPNSEKTQFLNLISNIEKFENSRGEVSNFKLEEKASEILSVHGTNIVMPFLEKQTVALYSYTMDNEGKNLIVKRNEK